MLTRFALDTALRSPLPFLGVIAAAFGQSEQSASWLSVALTLAGLAAPFTGLLGQRFGQRRMVFLPLATFALSCALMAVAPTFGAVLVLCVTLGIAKSMFDPQMQLFIGEQVPYDKRGTVIGIVELSWALSWAIGVPVFGYLVSRVSWWSPFLLMGLVAALGAAAVWATARNVMHAADATIAFSLNTWRSVWRNPKARWFLLFMVGITIAAQLPYLVYPLWMQRQFKLSIEALGIASIVIGVADFVAEVLVVGLVDRIGKRRSVLIGGVFYALAYVLFWALQGTLAGMLVALFCIYLGFEFTLVASLPIASEMVPEARATMMGFFTAASSVGRIVGSLVALPLFGQPGEDRLWLVALAGFVSVGLSVAFSGLATRVRPAL
jgi:predicted MFS family arabinose efflux permease